MPTSSDYISEIQKYAPYFDPSQGNVMNELNRRAAEGADVGSVVYDALKPGGYNELTQSAQNYVDPTYAAQRTGLSGQLATAQTNAGADSTAATTAYDRLSSDLARTYAQRQANDPLARQGIVSGNAQNYQTDLQAQNYRQIGTDLATKLSTIAQTLGDTRTNIAQQSGDLATKESQDVQNLISGTRQSLNVAQNTPYGSSAQVNGNTVFGSNTGMGITNLFQNPGFTQLVYGAGSNPKLLDVVNTVLKPYNIHVNAGDLPSTTATAQAPAPAAAAPTTTTRTVAPPAAPKPTATIPNQTQVVGDLKQYFMNQPWQGNDQRDLTQLQKQYGLTPDQASYLYYQTRKSVTGH